MDSTADSKKKPRAYILDLPTELLQQIARNCSDETLVILRLTCRKIEAATLDMWAKEYISRLECFMLDPARLRRVKSIISSRLAPHVRGVVLTLCAYDCLTVSSLGHCLPLHFAPKEHQSREWAQTEFSLDCEIEQYGTHARELEGFSAESDNLIVELIRIIAGLQDCSIGIDTQSERVTHGRLSKCLPQLTKHILDTAFRENCIVDRLSLSDDFPLKAAHFEHGGTFESVARGLRRFSYLMRHEDESALQTTWSQQHFRIIASALEKAKHLDYFEIANDSNWREMDEGELLPNLLEQTFEAIAAPLPLRTLQLDGLNLKLHTLLRVLKSCADTLETVLDALRAMPTVPTLLLRRLYGGASDAATFDDDGWEEVEWDESTEVEQLYGKMAGGTSVDARIFLELTKENYIGYRENERQM